VQQGENRHEKNALELSTLDRASTELFEEK
jgi:hypothetical protein